MKKEELEKKIKNKNTVYIIEYGIIIPYKLNEDFVVDNNWLCKVMKFCIRYKDNNTASHNDNICTSGDYLCKLSLIDETFSTEKEAKHYLNCGNIIRTETLPFVTWQEFKKGKIVEFSQGHRYITMETYVATNNKKYIRIWARRYPNKLIGMFHKSYNEKNYYEAYEFAKKTFLGG